MKNKTYSTESDRSPTLDEYRSNYLNFGWCLEIFPWLSLNIISIFKHLLLYRENGVVVQRSPIEQNPLVDVGFDGLSMLQLAINTAQTGRTFQDRSHAFWLVPRTDTKPSNLLHNIYSVTTKLTQIFIM